MARVAAATAKRLERAAVDEQRLQREQFDQRAAGAALAQRAAATWGFRLSGMAPPKVTAAKETAAEAAVEAMEAAAGAAARAAEARAAAVRVRNGLSRQAGPPATAQPEASSQHEAAREAAAAATARAAATRAKRAWQAARDAYAAAVAVHHAAQP